ncbi:MAG: hypothetical protein WCO68_02465 [Verrucomicrobiota bacterium]
MERSDLNPLVMVGIMLDICMMALLMDIKNALSITTSPGVKGMSLV